MAVKQKDRCYESAVKQGDVRPRLDKANGVVYGLKILGPSSKNNRKFLDSAFTDVADHINSKTIKSNLNHPENFENPAAPIVRRVQDRFGKFLRGTGKTTPGVGAFADYKYNQQHPFARQFEWCVENAPDMLGCSVDALLRGPIDRATGLKIVQRIPELFFVDIVSDPGSTQSLFEADTSAANKLDGSDDNPMEAVEDDSTEGPDEHIAMAVLEIARDSSLKCAEKMLKIKTLLKLMDDPEEPEKQTEMSAETKTEDTAGAKESADLKLELARLKLENDDLRATEAKRVARIDAKQKCGDLELSTDATTELFIDVLVQHGREQWEPLIRDRKSIVGTGAASPTSHERNEGAKPSIDDFEKFTLGGSK